MNEHEEKYEALAHVLGVDALRRLVPVGADRISAALAAGDEHLNGIPLAMWDCAAGVKDGPYADLRRTSRTAPWSAVPSLSLCERVCVLKHVAKFHLAKAGAR